MWPSFRFLWHAFSALNTHHWGNCKRGSKKPQETRYDHPKTDYHLWFLAPRANCRKKGFPAEFLQSSAPFLQNNALSCRKKMNFPAVFRGHMAGNRWKLQESFRAQESRKREPTFTDVSIGYGCVFFTYSWGLFTYGSSFLLTVGNRKQKRPNPISDRGTVSKKDQT